MKEALVLLGKLPRATVRPPLVKLSQAEIEPHPHGAHPRRTPGAQRAQRRMSG